MNKLISTFLEFLPELLIEERKRLGLTQSELAKRLDLKAQQIQKYEASRYQSASLKRLCEVAEALSRDGG